MKHEHSTNMLIGAMVVMGLMFAWSQSLPADEEIVEATPVLEVEPVPFGFTCWSGKTEMIRYENVVEAERLVGGDWMLTQQGRVEHYYRPRGGEYCGVQLQ